MKNAIGIMQGRLSPPRDGRIQCFPTQTWREEFPKAQACGLDLIEWIFEAEEWERNPLMTDAGLQEVQLLSARSGVRILSVCADYFMDKPLLRVNREEQEKRLEMLSRLVAQCAKAGVRYIELPFVDASSINSPAEIAEVARCIKACAPLAQNKSILLCLETALAPQPFLQLLREIGHPSVKVNYDIGNSASLGYDTRQELDAYGAWVATVHIKDRVKGGSTVPLGTGDANFQATFEELSRLRFNGPLIFQSARQGEEVETLRGYLKFIKPYLDPLEVSLN